jgi:hypothetical protein
LNDPLIGGTPSVLEPLIEVIIQTFLNLTGALSPVSSIHKNINLFIRVMPH